MSSLIGHLGEGRRSGARKERVLADNPLSTGEVHEEDSKCDCNEILLSLSSHYTGRTTHG